MKTLINSLLAKIGYNLVKKNNWRPKHKHEFLSLPVDIENLIKSNSMLNDLRLINIIDCVNYLTKNNIKGDMAECGVWKGGGAAMIAYQLKTLNEFRALHLFDAFDDICQPDANIDGDRAISDAGGIQNAKGELKPISGVYDRFGGKGNDEAVFELITKGIGYPSNFVRMHKGWFQDTLPQVSNSINEIALLRLDGDWYASTKVCLDYLFEKVVKGGIIIIDDYDCYEGCKKAVDEYITNNKLVTHIVKVDDECIYWIKQ
jgi:hypothetical protein